jgi:hypothetical protein
MHWASDRSWPRKALLIDSAVIGDLVKGRTCRLWLGCGKLIFFNNVELTLRGVVKKEPSNSILNTRESEIKEGGMFCCYWCFDLCLKF